MKLSYQHQPDITAGAYSAGDWRKPAGTESGDITFSLTGNIARLCSHWSSSYITALSLVETLIVTRDSMP